MRQNNISTKGRICSIVYIKSGSQNYQEPNEGWQAITNSSKIYYIALTIFYNQRALEC